MLIASAVDSWGNAWGFGASRTLVKGADFNCNTSICYGIGQVNHALFQQLQSTLNQYAKLGLSAYSTQLTVDGFIGANTVSAARAAAAAALMASPGTTKEQIAANAQVLQDGLQAFLGGVNAPKSAVPVATTAPTAPMVAPPTSVVTPSTATVTSATRPLPQAAAAAASIPNLNPATATAIAPASAAATSVAPIVTTKKTPLWVWITAGAVGVIVVGSVGYVLLRDDAKPAAKPATAKAALARRRRR